MNFLDVAATPELCPFLPVVGRKRKIVPGISTFYLNLVALTNKLAPCDMLTLKCTECITAPLSSI